jgi:probable HAF family extracellular repeat protein
MIEALRGGLNMNRIKHVVVGVATTVVMLGLPAWSQMRHSKMHIFTASELSRMAHTLKSAQIQAGQSQTGTFTTIDFPGSFGTAAFAINPQGQVVGAYLDASGNEHGFVLSRGTFTSIDVPGAVLTDPNGINSEGQIVGVYVSADQVTHGFLLSNGVFSTIDFPGGIFTAPQGINPSGEVVGTYADSSGVEHGYSMRGGVFTSIDFPGAVFTGVFSDNARGDIVGGEDGGDGNTHGLLLRQGSFTTFDFPGAVESTPACFGNGGTVAFGINPEDAIVGVYCGADGMTNHGFLLSQGNFSTIDFPGALFTDAVGINSNGDIVGEYIDGSAGIHGFLLTK